MTHVRDLDCLFIHSPKANNHYLPLGDFMNICYMPMGLPAVVEWVQRHGHAVELLHLGVEWIRDSNYSVVRDFDGANLGAVGVSLYWHYQSYDSIEVARAMARSHPEAFVFLGGVTSAYFAKEILETYPEIDAVIPGHGEGPMLVLMDEIKGDRNFGRVPNLVWRDGEGVIRDNRQAKVSYFGKTPDIDKLVYGDLSVLRNADIYADSFGFPLAYSLEYSRADNKQRLNMGRPFFPLFTGRGCPWLCTFCGGNRDTLKRVNGGGGVAWRSPARVVEDVQKAMDFGYKTMSLCFDPTPMKDDYYVALFEQIRRAKLDVDFYFECWGLPTERFVRDFRRTFPSPESYVALSPDAGDQGVRKINKQPFYTNEELYASVALLEKHAVSADVFYTIALPGERLAEARRTRDQMRDLPAKFSNIRRCMVWSVQLEPGSPQFETPERFNMTTDRSSFADFYRVHSGVHADTYSSLGFKIDGYFGDERDEGGIQEFERHLQHLKCMEFCFLAPDPRDFALPEKGRAHCFERRKSLAEKRGHQPPQRAIGEGYDYVDALEEEKEARGSHPRMTWT
jgi:radical SAM superfamily enzyme YgiQ (UPF0313 family)